MTTEVHVLHVAGPFDHDLGQLCTRCGACLHPAGQGGFGEGRIIAVSPNHDMRYEVMSVESDPSPTYVKCANVASEIRR